MTMYVLRLTRLSYPESDFDEVWRKLVTFAQAKFSFQNVGCFASRNFGSGLKKTFAEVKSFEYTLTNYVF